MNSAVQVSGDGLPVANQPLVECIPNFSEGRRPEVVQAIAGRIRGVAGVCLLDQEMDPVHNRSVITFAGRPAAVAEAAFEAVRKAAELIDMRTHTGAHPRIGAADVVPLVPLQGATMAEAVALARTLGAQIGEELKIPVYMYGGAALRPERRDLPALREGEYEGLARDIAVDPERRPDYGPAHMGPAGATAVGARPALVAFNVNIAGLSVQDARAIARAVRESSGGLPAVRAIGLDLPDRKLVQVSMNLTDFRVTSVGTAYDAVVREALARGGEVVESEIIGLLPRAALPPDAINRLRLHAFSESQILERRLVECGW